MVLNELQRPDPGSDDPRDDPFPNEPTPEDAVLPLPDAGDAGNAGDAGEGVERAGFGAEADGDGC